MVKRKETPDVMDELFGGQEPAQEEPKKRPAKQQTSKPASQYTNRLKAYMEQDKAKATYYLSPETMAELEEAWLRLRKAVASSVGQEQRGQVSKSLLVEAALQIVLEELEQEGMDSRLAKKITGWW